ncbi:MAG TPA: ABC transporter permease subunit, partial [Anaerolineae bacterium]|nr:ABC transporter permease subunit [Anaerolineae bacterium]
MTDISPPINNQSTTTANQPSPAITLAWRIAKQFGFILTVILAIIYLSHVGLSVSPQTPLSQALIDGVPQSLTYIQNALSGDFGMTQPNTVGRRTFPVTEIAQRAVFRSLYLLTVTFGISILVGLFFGILAARTQRKSLSSAILLISFVGISTPSFFAALFLQIGAISIAQFRGRSLVPVGGYDGSDWKYFVIPVIVLAARPVAQITRVTFITIRETYAQDFVRVAFSKGLRSHYILLVHVLRNASVPLITTIAISLRFALSSLPVVEQYFGWGGIGQVLIDSFFTRDINMTIFLLIALGLIFITLNNLLELSYGFLDPRMRHRDTETAGGTDFSLLATIRTIPSEIHALFFYNPASAWIKSHLRPDTEPSPFRTILEQDENRTMPEDITDNTNTWAFWYRGVINNPSLLVGGFIVGSMIFLLFFGPSLAPHSPNTTQPIAMIDGELTTPPFPPSETHPWGT